jgi:hypothetical protein
MRVWTYLLVLAAVLALPAAATAGIFGGTETSVVLQTPSQTVPPPPSPTPVAPSAKPGFVEEPANIPTTVPTTMPPTTTPPTVATTLTVATTPSTTATTVAPAPPVTDPSVAALEAGATSASWVLANARPEGIDVFAAIDAAAPTIHVTDQTEWGTHRVLLVLERSGEWLQVLVPVRPNNAVGWVRAATVDLTQTIDEIHVSLANRVLEWKHGDTTQMISSVAIGAPQSPTPSGIYYVTDILATDGAYGPFALALNGHSDTYATFNGGDARIALHGTNAPGTIGQAASHGCVRLPNATTADLAQRVPIGTPVIIS